MHAREQTYAACVLEVSVLVRMDTCDFLTVCFPIKTQTSMRIRTPRVHRGRVHRGLVHGGAQTPCTGLLPVCLSHTYRNRRALLDQRPVCHSALPPRNAHRRFQQGRHVLDRSWRNSDGQKARFFVVRIEYSSRDSCLGESAQEWSSGLIAQLAVQELVYYIFLVLPGSDFQLVRFLI